MAVSAVPPRLARINSAIKQAIKYHMTLILTFHRIKSQATDPPGYPLALFKQTISDIRQSGIKVLTLSQLDKSNGVPVDNNITYQPAVLGRSPCRCERRKVLHRDYGADGSPGCWSDC